MPVLSPSIRPSDRPLRAVKPPQAQPVLTPWMMVRLSIWCLAVLFAFVSVVLLSVIGGVCYGVLAGIGKVAGELTTSAVRDLRILFRWATR